MDLREDKIQQKKGLMNLKKNQQNTSKVKQKYGEKNQIRALETCGHSQQIQNMSNSNSRERRQRELGKRNIWKLMKEELSNLQAAKVPPSPKLNQDTYC